MPASILIVAYGNPLRCDDGVAWRVADALEGKFSASKVEILLLHQLAPEIADFMRNRELVIFIDAACVDDIHSSRPGEIRVRKLSGEEIRKHPSGQFSHVYSPEKVVALARELYDASPKAMVITVAGENFEHGESLSAPVASALPELISTVERLVKDAKRMTTKATT